jgi:hypothetical protein
MSIDDLLARMDALLVPMREASDERRHFLEVYARTTLAARDELTRQVPDGFLDPDWTERWTVAWADLYLEALIRWNEDGSAPGPWQVAFEAATEGPRVAPGRHLLLGLSAHLTYDLPQSLIEVVGDEEFRDRELIVRRTRDHEHADRILAGRLPEEERLLDRVERATDRTSAGRPLAPFGRTRVKRSLRDARAAAWRNAGALSVARRKGPRALKARLDELGERSAERVAALRRPSRLGRLSRRGLGVVLDDA